MFQSQSNEQPSISSAPPAHHQHPVLQHNQLQTDRVTYRTTSTASHDLTSMQTPSPTPSHVSGISSVQTY
ncbi:hypothetical protein ANN_28100 [Periplaneta americana]|uniref:Uncharacterized protein n=1 Tax=Periplaneta americana TaxID=6978 RepID=A0ABQ8RUT1_PERAM|nr:hypothetical protein ANN_28100 [Periplaneta americana]